MMKKQIEKPVQPRDYTALFAFIACSPEVEFKKGADKVVLRHGEKTMSLTTVQITLLVTKGLITRQNSKLILTDAGHNLMPANHSNRDHQITLVENDLTAVNKDESPLSTLANRKLADGTSFLQLNEFEAGERIRVDFTHSMLMPRTSANWQTSVSGGKRSGGANGVEEITHAAISARNRLDNALQCLGRDLAGVVTDICCYLKGFEQVEMERKWPKRSAKFMLKAALATLALHYNPPAKRDDRQHKWGAPDYRPKIRV
jgi:hypothetical protein